MPKALNKERLDAIGKPATDRELRGLSWHDLSYLKDRGKLTPHQEQRAGFYPRREGGSYPPGEGPEDSFATAAEAATAPNEEEEDYEEELESEEDEEVEGEEGEVDYDGWSKEELQAEIDERNKIRADDDQLPRTGTKPKLAQLLRDDDGED